jgi:putative transposase
VSNLGAHATYAAHGAGYIEQVTRDNECHGTMTVFAALDIANGEAPAECQALHSHQEFLSFLRQIDANVPRELDIHLILDNNTARKLRQSKSWLARHERCHVHFVPAYSSWLNQVERWFAIITYKAIRRAFCVV